MDRSGMHHNESSGRAESNGGGKPASRRKSSKTGGELTPAELRREIAQISARAGKMTRTERLAAAAKVRGDWADRPEWKGMSSAEVARELRRSVVGNRRG